MDRPTSMPHLQPDKPCPCKSGMIFEKCCGPLLCGREHANTAEALMRSRYTAFTLKNWDYLVTTHHPSTRVGTLRQDLERYDDNPQWFDLKILSISAGQPKDKTGKIKFEASYFSNGETHILSEHSRFKRYKGEWKYLDAV